MSDDIPKDDIAEVLNAKLRELGILPPAQPGQTNEPEDSGARPDLPLLEMPRDGWGLDDFAREAGKVTKSNGIFRRDAVPVVINRDTGSIEPLEADTFRTYLADLAFLFKWRAGKASVGKETPPPERVKVSMGADTARGCLKSPQFIGQQRKLSRVNSVRQPIMRPHGGVELLPEGYDPESGVYTMPSDVVIREDMPIEAARELLLDLHREFPFCDWSHCIRKTNPS